MSDFGKCPRCGGLLRPEYFTEEEYKVIDGRLYKTHRTRKAVSHLYCENCLHKEAVDDSFDGAWR